MFRFTIDNWFNRYIPPNQTYKFPQPFRRFTGGHVPKPVADYWIWLEVLVSTFCGVLLLGGVFTSDTVFYQHDVTTIIASYGASAILCFNASLGPLAQPRNVLFGHFIGAAIGMSIQRLFLLSAAAREYYYVGGALSVAILSVVMSILNCVHPPAGASALLPCIDPSVQEMGWWFLPAQLVSSVLIISAACITGNVIRVYPTFWWTAGEVGKPKPAKQIELLELEPKQESELESQISLKQDKLMVGVVFSDVRAIEITANTIQIPHGFPIELLHVEWMETLQRCLKDANL